MFEFLLRWFKWFIWSSKFISILTCRDVVIIVRFLFLLIFLSVGFSLSKPVFSISPIFYDQLFHRYSSVQIFKCSSSNVNSPEEDPV